jgi:hypothetical protein
LYNLYLGRRMVVLLVLVIVFWTIAQAIFAVFDATTERPALFWLSGAHVLQNLLIITLLALLIASNVRRPRGIDPNSAQRRVPDPFGLDTSELLDQVRLQDGNPYGKRATDDPSVAARIIKVLKEEKERVPAWVHEKLSEAPALSEWAGEESETPAERV